MGKSSKESRGPGIGHSLNGPIGTGVTKDWVRDLDYIGVSREDYPAVQM
ncbi:MAG: hypothetical protein ACK5H4_24560 [Lacrimispora sphenoides]